MLAGDVASDWLQSQELAAQQPDTLLQKTLQSLASSGNPGCDPQDHLTMQDEGNRDGVCKSKAGPGTASGFKKRGNISLGHLKERI